MRLVIFSDTVGCRYIVKTKILTFFLFSLVLDTDFYTQSLLKKNGAPES